MENVLTLKNNRISFLHKLPAETLKIPKSEFYTVNTTSIPITLLSNGSAPSPLAKSGGPVRVQPAHFYLNYPVEVIILQSF